MVFEVAVAQSGAPVASISGRPPDAAVATTTVRESAEWWGAERSGEPAATPCEAWPQRRCGLLLRG